MEADLKHVITHVKFETLKAVVGRVLEPEKSSKMAFKVIAHKNINRLFLH